jgi:methylmalonyl-CoA/ethylmalonyl-CoA epimerase
MKVKRLDHVSFAVADVGGMTQMLQRLLGLPVLVDADLGNTRKALLDAGNAKIELLFSADPKSRTGSFIAKKGLGFFHLSFEVDDVAEAARALAEHGVGLLEAHPIRTPEGGLAIFTDPATTGGIMLEFKQAGPSPVS